MQKSNSKWLWPFAMFFVATFFYLYEFLLRVIPSVMLPQLFMEYQIGAEQYGVLASIYYASYAPLQLPVGAWIDRYGPRRLLTFAILLCAVSTLLSAYTTNFEIALLARLLIGAGSAFGFISCIKIVAIWFPPSWFPVLTGFTLTIGTLGAVASAPISFAMNFIHWRTLLIILGIIGIGIAILSWLVIRDKPQGFENRSPEKIDNFWLSLKEVVKRPQSWLVGFYAFLTTAPTDAFGGAWGVPFLTDSHGIDKDLASIAQAMTFVGMAIGSPVLGWIAKQFDSRKLPMFVAAIIATLALSVLIYSPAMSFRWAAFLFFIFGAFGTYVLAFIVIRHITEFQFVATAVGFVNMISMIGSMLIISFIGRLLDLIRTGLVHADGTPVYLWSDYKIGLLIFPVFYAVAAILVVPLINDRSSQGNKDNVV